ncbi:Heme-degrading monooxygenase HmoA [Lentzea albidocapillata subsp. violacea]|uniref:Heme-degrading monooxygenase HmoA n=1 Tax=Lentzea albidocapillata subsp. violacea TaxID=128104 RepID=A0A1G9LT00_9PSEU|nr:antibiotic biosynthesis monooxygenase family protein [Lentzea albidocapillata]SDL64914.1 Heme-degrading monooxygenase HmoA [Lentzea albidocapillata subsp. violacea]
MASSVFRVMLRMHVKPGMAGDFERVWREVGHSVTGDPANLGQWLSRSAEEEDIYYIVSDWTGELEFRRFETSERHVEHRQKLHPYRIGGSMTTMTVVAHLAGTAVSVE